MELLQMGKVSEKFFEESKNIEIFTTMKDDERERLGEFGIHLWKLGYCENDSSEDEEEVKETEEEAEKSYRLSKIIMSDDHTELDEIMPDELEWISDDPILRNMYNNRWYRYNNNDTYVIMANRSGKVIKKGEQLTNIYGSRSNSYWFENYGFSLNEDNLQAALEFRVTLATNPKDKIEHAKVLLMTEA
jgi:hypothetical protein